ncbi:MAG: DUF1553 domain-containing protein [Verrucomicrobiales bacterium]
MRTHIPAIGACVVLASPFFARATGPDFVTLVQPILEQNCVRCHNAEQSKGGLRMDTHAAVLEGGDTAEALVPGKPEESEMLVRVLLRPIDQGVMPDEGKALEPAEVKLLEEWVRAGAYWPSGVILTERKPEPPKRVSIPAKPPASAAEAAAILDDILKRENAGKELITTRTISDSAFLRRTTIDLIGRIPTMDELKAFKGMDGNQREKLIDQLLAHPRFSDRWTVFMADTLRIRSNVTGGNQLLAYVHGSIEKEKPYDVMVRELISASGRANANPAVGFILGDDVNPMELAASSAQVFMGVQIGCAMCHDHPFDDWKQRDFYEFAAFFGKTRKVQGRQQGMVYTTEGQEMTVLWPPEDKANGGTRSPVKPRFPIRFDEPETPPAHLVRFLKAREEKSKSASSGKENAELDALLDGVQPAPGKPRDVVLEEAQRESRALDVHRDLYRTSELRDQLASLITDPRNDYFAKAFVNRVWAELIGRGFVESLDNFSDYNLPRNPTALDFLSREFVASGYDFRHLIRIITLSDAYRRTALPASTPVLVREESEKNFSAAPTRRMIGEVLFDSVIVAGHLSDHKWPAGANAKQVTREVRVPIKGQTTPAKEPAMAEAPAAPPMRDDGYDLESTLKLDFNAILTKEERSELESMRAMSDQQIEAERMLAMQRQNAGNSTKFETKTVVETVDDNPRFDSAMHMATPAPPAHFLRVFGQPERAALGEFRDASPSLRQQLMMLNGRMTHEASRVGPLEPLHAILQKDPDKAIDWAYQEILTRLPSAEEKAEALALLANNREDGMADLRWALLNSHEFRYLP